MKNPIKKAGALACSWEGVGASPFANLGLSDDNGACCRASRPSLTMRGSRSSWVLFQTLGKAGARAGAFGWALELSASSRRDSSRPGAMREHGPGWQGRCPAPAPPAPLLPRRSIPSPDGFSHPLGRPFSWQTHLCFRRESVRSNCRLLDGLGMRLRGDCPASAWLRGTELCSPGKGRDPRFPPRRKEKRLVAPRAAVGCGIEPALMVVV